MLCFQLQFQLLSAADMHEEKVRILRSLGAVRDKKLIQRVLDLSLSVSPTGAPWEIQASCNGQNCYSYGVFTLMCTAKIAVASLGCTGTFLKSLRISFILIGTCIDIRPNIAFIICELNLCTYVHSTQNALACYHLIF